jgi:hypothetical protein
MRDEKRGERAAFVETLADVFSKGGPGLRLLMELEEP